MPKPVGNDAQPIAAAMLQAVRLIRRGKRNADGSKATIEDAPELPNWDDMSNNQRNKLIKATRYEYCTNTEDAVHTQKQTFTHTVRGLMHYSSVVSTVLSGTLCPVYFPNY